MKLNFKKYLPKKNKEKFKKLNFIKESLLWFSTIRIFQNIFKYLNKQNFGMLFLIFLFIIFISIVTIDNNRRKSIYIDNEQVDSILADWSSKANSLNFVTVMEMYLLIYIFVALDRRPRKPQLFTRRQK